MTMPRRSTRRQVQADATRTEVVSAAARLFATRGYVATTLEAVAAEAGVALQTIYNAVGNKRALLEAALDLTVSGPEAPRTVPTFMAERTAAAADADAVVEVLAEWFTEAMPRTSGIVLAIDEAAAVDPAAAELATRRAGQRLANYARAADELARRGSLRPGLGREEAAALIWAVGHPGVYRVLVVDGGWAPSRYRAWVADMLRAGLLAP
jgi:AcrR family transcriptional regulator